jgi:hypothetical protein
MAGGLIMGMSSRITSNVRRFGRDFQNLSNGKVVRGFTQAEQTAMFVPGSPIAPGDCLKDQRGDHYLVTDCKQQIGYLSVHLHDCHLFASVSRHVDGQVNAFGQSDSEPVTVITDLPIVIKSHQTQGFVSVSANIKKGDLLKIASIDESYRVTGIIRSNDSGLLVLALARQSADGMLSKM